MHPLLADYLQKIGADPDTLEGWAVQQAYRDGEFVGVFCSKGTEVHMLAFTRAAMTKKNILDHLAPIVDEYGYCTTKVPKSESDHKLREALGFTYMWSDENFTYWCMTELPFQRKTK